MGLNSPGKGIQNEISVKKRVYATIADRFKSNIQNEISVKKHVFILQ